MFRSQELHKFTHAAPMRMIYYVGSVRFHMVVIHVGEAGNCTSTNKLLATIADEIELAVGGGVNCPALPAAHALKRALAWYAGDLLQ